MKVSIDYDKDYGVDNRSGFSICIDGSYYVQFRKDPFTALLIALYKHIEARLDMRDT